MRKFNAKNVDYELEENQEYDLSGERDQSLEASSDGNESTEENDTLVIPECKTSIDFSQYYLSKELDDEDHFDALMSILSRWDVVENIKKKLMKAKVSKKKEVWFIIEGKPIRFGMKEFAMITGLNCGKYPPNKALYEEKKAKDFLGVVMNKDSNLIGSDLKKKMESNRLDAQTKLKITMVWDFEAIPILGEAFGQPLTKSPCLLFPRLIRWYGKKRTPPDYHTVLLTIQNKENLEDEVDENIDRLTKAVDGMTQLIKYFLERPEFSVVVDHGRHETSFRRQPSMRVTEDTNVLNKLSQLVKFCEEMLDEMKVQDKKLHDRMDGLDVKVDKLTDIVDELRVQVENLSKKEV
ncbi:hypothetical protein FXO38_30375 [Capsicum annuum]|nr:hypothetical protein FXO38_30375 [Capsicum annuum]KAF3625450.1 hypothetical protein FXO37_30852 [Capsicum annuum]